MKIWSSDWNFFAQSVTGTGFYPDAGICLNYSVRLFSKAYGDIFLNPHITHKNYASDNGWKEFDLDIKNS